LLHPTTDPASANISVVRNWRGKLPGNTTSNKVPSLIAIDEDGEVFWGFDIPHDLQAEAFKWLKLLLEPKQQLKEVYDSIFDPSITIAKLRDLRRTAVEIASEYLRLLFEHAKSQIIQEHSQATYNFAQKSIVLTVPAVWSNAAKHNTYLVAAGAGLADEEYQLKIVSEPEAAAIAVLQERGSLLEVCRPTGG
jgi:molecular chaperone DnaK (HSP70)